MTANTSIKKRSLLLLLFGIIFLGCKTMGNGTDPSRTLDHNQSELVGGQAEIAYYWATGVGPNDQVIRGVCPNGLPLLWQRRRDKCSLDTKSVAVSEFKRRIEIAFTQTYGPNTFSDDMKQVLIQWLTFLASQQTQTDPSRVGPKTATLLPLMYQAVLGDQGGADGGQGSGTLPNQDYAFPGNGIAPEFSWTAPSGIVLSRLKTTIDDNCPFNIVGITAQTAQGLRPLRSISFEKASSIWVSDAGPIETNRLSFSFQGAPGGCHFRVTDRSQEPDQAGGGSPSYVMLLLSTQSFLGWMAPNKTHTFAVFAHLDPQGHLIEHVPFSWLPVSTNQQSVQSGQSGQALLSNNHFQIGSIMTLAGQGRTGWVFSLRETYAKVNNGVEGLFIYPIQKSTFDRAKDWRQELNSNTRQAFSQSPQFGPIISSLGDHYLYFADDRVNFAPGCSNPKPAAMNCFHAVAALSDICLETGNLSGRKASLLVMDAFRARGLVPLMPFSQDPGLMNTLVGSAIGAEASGAFDRP